MKIKNLGIDNFRGIKHLKIDLSDANGKPLDVVVIAGPNGCGKTSILEAVAILMGHADLLPSRDERDLNEVYFGASSCTLKAVVEDNDEWNLSKTLYPGKNPPKSKKAGQIEYFPSWRAPKLVGSVSVSVNGVRLKDDKRVENNLSSLKQALVNLTASQAFETSAAAPEVSGELRQILEKLNSVWSHFFPDRKEHFIPDAVQHAIGSRFDLFLKGRGSSPIPVDSLSSGEIEIISLIGRIARKDSENGIILIDEPELHLHPAWHRVILKALMEVVSGAQVIVATHSPQIIGSTETENVRIIQRTDIETRALRAKSSLGLDSNRVLEELMGADERLPEIKEELSELFHLIGDKKLTYARIRLKALKEKLPEEPELTRAEAILSRMEVLGK